jgi:broad specificity phosphatase PhoE
LRLFLVRHGESVGNAERRLQGARDYDLTALGRRQASHTGERLAAAATTALYGSPLLRAFGTAELIGEQLGIAAQPLPGVQEYDFGELSGATYAELRARFAAGAGQGDAAVPAERVYPGEEGRENFYRRVTESLWSVIESHPGENVAVVSHGGPIALFCQAVLGLAYRRPMPFAIDNCSVTAFEVRENETPGPTPRRIQLSFLNDTCHLDRLRGER